METNPLLPVRANVRIAIRTKDLRSNFSALFTSGQRLNPLPDHVDLLQVTAGVPSVLSAEVKVGVLVLGAGLVFEMEVERADAGLVFIWHIHSHVAGRHQSY